MTRSVELCVSARFLVPLDEAWESVTRGDLTRASQPWGPIPGVVAIHDEPPGFFVEPGKSRTLENSDGSTVRETITALDPPRSLDYTITELTNSFRHLTSGASAGFRFVPVEENTTCVTWRYSWHARSASALLPLGLIARLAFRPYMRRMLERMSRAHVGSESC